MLTSKTFVKKTKKGGILKIVREHYLRDDIWCSSQRCTKCKHEAPLLKAEPRSSSDLCTSPHYIIIDTNVVLHQLDVLKDEAFCDVIVPQTVLQEVRHRHGPRYKILREIISNKDRRFYAFVNEHHKDTYVERAKGETANDRNDRAIRQVAAWYSEHLSPTVTVVLLTEDEDNRTRALAEGVRAFTFSEYVNSLKDHPLLADKLALPGGKLVGGDRPSSGPLYPEYLPAAALQAGLRDGRFLQGKFQASRDNYLEGNVVVGDADDDAGARSILIQGRTNLNRVVHEDTVVVEPFPEDLWSVPSNVILLDDKKNVEEDEDVDEQDVKGKKSVGHRVPTGRVVGILRRKWRPYCGVLEPSPLKGAIRHTFVPSERRIPKIRIETRQAHLLLGRRIVVSIDSWPRDSRYPQGHYVCVLGDIGDRSTENKVLLLEHDIPHGEFPQSVLACLPKMPWGITTEHEATRKDLRSLCVCSVDPPGCTDIDDALHCRTLPNGNLEVGVHIADVSHFVRPGTALDQEAANRGTTVYLVDQRIDMVPDLLSSNLCSLRGGEERLAFSVLWEMTAQAEVVSTQFHKTIIRSRAALTYAEAQARIDDVSAKDELSESLRNLNRLAKQLKHRRMANGALTLASSEVRFHVDTETHDPIDVKSKELLETNSMVEEWMLLANGAVAQHIYKEFPDCGLLRRHPVPPLSNFEPLVQAAQSKGFDLKVATGRELAISLDNAVLDDQPFFNVMLRMVATRCMPQALYFCTGCVAKEDFIHYGLALGFYTHFTSPIRRYSDLIVHRLLAAAIGADTTSPELLDKQKCQALCNNLNFRHRMAQYAGRASVGLYTQVFFKDRSNNEDGYVLFVRENALQVLLPKYGLESTLFLTSKSPAENNVTWTYDAQKGTQACGGVVLAQFDRITVQVSVDSSNVQHQRIVLKLVHPQVPGFSVPAQASSEEHRPAKKLKT
ncbi:exosome complex exonuclease RRP44-like [Ornithodoros turicata]|uniref:exosome complex exonuclease RRP44-like n=1 Tax=Ornithodoros turicata TaxID=34597 RepID=UPI00313A4BE8